MSDDLDIRSGGVVAVDTETLREAAGGFARLGRELEAIVRLVGSAGAQLFALPRIAWDVSSRVEELRRRIGDAVAHAQRADADLRAAAAVYEVVELRAARGVAEAAGETATLAAIEARIAVLADEYPDVLETASRGPLAWGLAWPAELTGQAGAALWWAPPGIAVAAGAGMFGTAQLARVVGAGTVPRDARLRVASTAIIVAPVRRDTRTEAPTTLAAAAARIPGGEGSRIRVEKYTMADGSRQFAVYVTGTQSFAPVSKDPFDMTSNVQLYSGSTSASYDATLAALRESGARPGDAVHAFGHSQGAMVTAHIALEGEFDTRTLVSFGPPVEADIGADTLSVSLRHTDDPVVALEGGGHDYPVGAPGSFVAERVADPDPGLHDVRLPAHGIAAYTETARMLDASTDPRMDPVRALLDELGAAASVESVEYSAERVTALPAPTPGPEPVSPSAAGGGSARRPS